MGDDKKEAQAESASLMKKAKAATADAPFHFAVAIKGGNEGGLLVSKHRIPPADVAALKKQASAGAAIQGICFGEKGALVFEIDHSPTGSMESAIKHIIKEQSGLMLIVQVRQSVNPALAGGGEAANKPAAATTHDSTPPVVPPVAPQAKAAAEEPAAEWKRRMGGALAPHLKEALRSGNPVDAAMIKHAFEVAEGHAGKGQFAQALSVMGQLETLVAKFAPPTPPPGAPKEPTAARSVPAVAPKAIEHPGQAGKWQQASKVVAGDVVKLVGALRETKIPVLHEIADEMLASLRNVVNPLTTALVNYEHAAAADKDAVRRKALELVNACEGQIAKDRLFTGADTNPFGVKVAARQTLGESLKTLKAELAGAGA